MFIAAAAVAPAFAGRAIARLTPVLHGDGKRDDTAALKALFAGEDVIVPANARYAVARLANGVVTLVGGRFFVRDSITTLANIKSAVLRDVTINNCRIG